MPKMIDVANRAGVSIATVSCVLSGTKYVSKEAREKVWKAIDELGYQPNALARSLRKQETKEIGVVLQNLKNLFFIDVLRGIDEYLTSQGYSAIYVDSGYDMERERRAVMQLRSRWVDGILLYSCVTEDEKDAYGSFLLQGGSKSIPIVSIDRDFRKYTVPLVTTDQERNAYAIVKHLISTGRTHIVHVAGRSGWEITESRCEGYRCAMEEAGLGENVYIEYGSNKPNDGYEIARKLIRERPEMDVIFAANDQMAIGCISAIQEMNMRVPEDIAVAGMDDLFVSTIVSPQLTTVNIPKYQLGKKAAQVLLNRIEDPDGLDLYNDMLYTLPSDLEIRQSTKMRSAVKWNLDNW